MKSLRWPSIGSGLRVGDVLVETGFFVGLLFMGLEKIFDAQELFLQIWIKLKDCLRLNVEKTQWLLACHLRQAS